MNNISFKILPSPATNDHEVRIFVDNEDFLGNNYLGIDPPSFFSQNNLDKSGELMVGRCTCGVEGCCDYPVTVSVNEKTISWTDNIGVNLLFDKTEYNNSITIAKNDHSWEDIKRKVERLATDILKHSKTKDNYNFDWVSTRIKDKYITLSYSKNDDQKLFDINWNGQSETDVEYKAKQFLKDMLDKE